jgi:hypothetical protein
LSRSAPVLFFFSSDRFCFFFLFVFSLCFVFCFSMVVVVVLFRRTRILMGCEQMAVTRGVVVARVFFRRWLCPYPYHGFFAARFSVDGGLLWWWKAAELPPVSVS